jgi:prolipoprotein diacylglyceryltransferase
MTQLGLLVGIVSFALTAVGSVLAFRRPGTTGGLLLVLVGLYRLLEPAFKQDPTLPASSLAFGLVLNLLVLVVGALVLAGRRSMGPPSATARDAMGVTALRME